MVLILSEKNDISTDHVIDWLRFFNVGYTRINDDEKLNLQKIILSNTEINFHLQDKIQDSVIDTTNIQTIWARRGYLNMSILPPLIKKKDIKEQIIEHLQLELSEIQDIFALILSKKKSIGRLDKYHTSKLNALLVAKKNKLLIPNTIIVTTKNELNKCKKELITKSIASTPMFRGQKELNLLYTELLSHQRKQNIPQKFFPSLFQEKIEKEFEIRVFYLNKKLYSMAIFSQNDPQTRIDFRKYNDTSPNRVCPYKLPKSIERRIINFMLDMELNCGSIDLIKDTDGNYIFLEVNPVGQFGNVSYYCNYQLEKIIATTLSYEKSA